MKQILTLAFILFTISYTYSQNNGFYLRFENDDKHTYANSYIPFATEIGTDQYVYLRNYNIYDSYDQDRKILGHENYLVLADNKGIIDQEILLSNDSLAYGQLIGFRINDNIVLTGYATKDSNCYLITYTFDLNLNQTEHNVLEIAQQTSHTSIYWPIGNVLNGKLYISLTDSPLHGAINLRFDGNGRFEIWKNVSEFSILDITGFTMSTDKSQLIFLTEGPNPNALIYDLDFNYFGKKHIYENDENIPLHLRWFSNYLLLDSTYLAFGMGSIDFNGLKNRGKFFGQLDADFRLKNVEHLDSTRENGYTDGPPQNTSGIFKGSDGYYTCYDISTGELTPHISTFIITKYNFDLELVWDRRFIIDSRMKFFSHYAELLPDNSFILSGLAADITKEAFTEDQVIGHIIKLNSDGSPPVLSTERNTEIVSFSIVENPVSSNFEIMKSGTTKNNISLRVHSINGKLLKQSKNWQSDRLKIDVSIFSPGTYLYTIVEESRVIYSGKFIKI